MKNFKCTELFCLFLLFGVATCHEVIIKDGTFSKKDWFGDPFLLFGPGGLWEQEKGPNSTSTCIGGQKIESWLLTNPAKAKENLDDVQIHIEIEAQVTACYSGVKCFQDGFELYRYHGVGEPNVPYKVDKEKSREFLRTNFTFLGNITGNTTSEERKKMSFTLRLRNFSEITFGIKSNGGCGTLYRMKVYYYVCKREFRQSVMFEETLSPPNGSVVVFGNCSRNSKPDSTKGVLKAYCYSNGSWGSQGVCLCDVGFEATTEQGCSPCQPNWYKSSMSNEKCSKCLNNMKSTERNTSCECKRGYFKFPSKLSGCYAPLKLEHKPKRYQIDEKSLNITWDEPKINNGINETVVYDIQCFVCDGESHCNRTRCKDLKYDPAGPYNITKTYVRVSGVDVGSTYVFRIYPKYSLTERLAYNSTEKLTVESMADKQQNKGDNFTYLVIFVCVASLTILLIVFAVAYCLRRRKEKDGLYPGLLTNGIELPTKGKKTYVDPSNYDRPIDAICEFAEEIDASLLYLEMFIGGGEFGDVYKGSITRPDGKKSPVAVKTLKKDATAKSEKDFLLEASVMGQFDCPNVIKLEGVVTKYRPWMIVIEFMSNGSLDNFLKANDGRLSHLELIDMAKGVAVGMEYLAGMNYVHRDLAARNVLVDGNLVCKVADFGLSRELEATDSSRGEYATTGGRIPIRWTAPEATKYRKFSSASDVWSFGILLWEIMSFAERPYWEWDNFKVMEEVDEGFRLPAPLNCPKAVHDLMMECWKKERIERPNFTEINTVIDGWIQSPKTMDGDVDLTAALREWLQSIKMDNYLTNITMAGYQRPCELYGVKEDDLKQIGINLVGHRNKILKGIKNLPGNKKGKRTLKKEISLEV